MSEGGQNLITAMDMDEGSYDIIGNSDDRQSALDMIGFWSEGVMIFGCQYYMRCEGGRLYLMIKSEFIVRK